MVREQEEGENATKNLDENDVLWEERKQRAGKLRDKKRGR